MLTEGILVRHRFVGAILTWLPLVKTAPPTQQRADHTFGGCALASILTELINEGYFIVVLFKQLFTLINLQAQASSELTSAHAVEQAEVDIFSLFARHTYDVCSHLVKVSMHIAVVLISKRLCAPEL